MSEDALLCASCGEATETEDLCAVCGDAVLLDGRYRLRGLIGQGAVGTTYRASDPEGHTVAVKELLIRRLDAFKTEELFHREARVLRQLEHHGIPRFVDEFAAGSGKSVGLYVVQEYVDGQTLEDYADKRRFTSNEVLELAAELLDILTYLHRLEPPVIHRDIKLKNVMRRALDGRLVLIDFGAVRDVIRDRADGSTVAGTFGYMPPEQFAGHATTASDLYAVGALMVALLSGRTPHSLLGSDNRLSWESAIDVDPPVRQLLADLLEPDVDLRVSDAAEAADRIRALLEGEEVQPRPPEADLGSQEVDLESPADDAPAAPSRPVAEAIATWRESWLEAITKVRSGVGILTVLELLVLVPCGYGAYAILPFLGYLVWAFAFLVTLIGLGVRREQKRRIHGSARLELGADGVLRYLQDDKLRAEVPLDENLQMEVSRHEAYVTTLSPAGGLRARLSNGDQLIGLVGADASSTGASAKTAESKGGWKPGREWLYFAIDDARDILAEIERYRTSSAWPVELETTQHLQAAEMEHTAEVAEP